MIKKLLSIGMVIIGIVAVTAIALNWLPMQPATLVAFRTQMLEDFMISSLKDSPSNEVAFVAFGQQASDAPDATDPPPVLIERLTQNTRHLCLPHSRLAEFNADGSYSHVFYISIVWNPWTRTYILPFTSFTPAWFATLHSG